MFDAIRRQVLRIMRVPHDPEPPLGAPGSVRIFRAGRNFYKLRLFRWGAGQTGAVIGILFSVGFLYWFTGVAEAARKAVLAAPVPTVAVAPAPAPVITPAQGPKPAAPASGKSPRKIRSNLDGIKHFAAIIPAWAIPLIEIFEVAGILFFLAQLPITFAAVRLEFEMHWYIVTDRSLRIRTGLFRLQESTMSFANLQQVEVKQGPLQRLLGLADVQVQSAGGSGGNTEQHGDSLHTGIFHSVENANEIRDLIQERLRQFRQAGLGDPDDHHTPVLGTHEAHPVASDADALDAAREILEEARALRQMLS